jgi:hypothetical protein
MSQAFWCVLALTVGTAGQAPTGLKPDANLPGPLNPYNVTGPYKGHFHDLIAEFGMEPTVLIIARGLDFTGESKDHLPDLLKNLDGAIEKNPNARLHTGVIFLIDDLMDVVTEDDKREGLTPKIEDLGKGLKHVVLTLDSKKYLDKYDLGDAAVTVILYNKMRIVSVHSLTKGKLDEQALNQILAEVADKLGAKRK